MIQSEYRPAWFTRIQPGQGQAGLDGSRQAALEDELKQWQLPVEQRFGLFQVTRQYRVVQLQVEFRDQVAGRRAPALGTRCEGFQRQRVAAVVERHLTLTEYMQLVHPLNITGTFLDHGDVVDLAHDAQDQFDRHVGAAGGRVVVEHDRQVYRGCDGAVVLDNLALAELPVRSW